MGRVSQASFAMISRGVSLAALLAASTIATSTAARAQTAFDIPAGPLSRVLAAFGKQSGTQLSYEASIAGATTSPGIKGKVTREEALTRILNGSGLVYSFADSKNVLIERPMAVGEEVAPDGSILLDTITVVGKSDRLATSGAGYQDTPDWVYETPASVSVVSRAAIKNNPATRSAADTLDTVAGVLTNRTEAQRPGISINLRGLQDMNRVTTSIDGARQNFQRAGHGAYQQTLVDTAFIRGIEVEKGAVNGVGGAGALGGMVNFRTIEVGDIIAPDRRFGGEVEAGTGTNAYKFNGSAILAGRLSDNFSLLAGIGGKNIGDYKIGSRGELEVEAPDGNTIVDDKMLYSRVKTMSTLVKAEWQATPDLKVEAAWLRYEADGSQGGNLWGAPRRDDEHYVNNTLTSVFTYDPGSDLINAKARFWYNDTVNDEKRGYDTGKLPVTYGMESFGGSLENTSRFTVGLGDLTLHYGGEAFHDDGETKTENLDDPNGPDGHYGFGGANPSGKRTMASGFFNTTLQHEEWLTLTGGLRYDHYDLWGSTVVQNQRTVVTPPQNCLAWQDIDSDGRPDPNGLWYDQDGTIWQEPGPGREHIPPTCERWERPGGQETVYDRFPVDVDQSGGALLPSAILAVKPFDWLQPFVSYAQTYRPPAITEALISGGHPSVPYENMPNPDLKPERGETWEFGVNILEDGIFTEDDTLRLKAVYFHRDIEDYISMGKAWYAPANRLYYTFLNLDGTTRMKGIEVEASYDLGFAYLGASYTHLDADFADSYNLVVPPGNGGSGPQPPSPAVLFVPPKEKITVDAGVRLFDKRLVGGGRVTHVAQTTPEHGQLVGGYVNKDYTVYDLYGSWAATDKITLRFGVNNVTDEKYVPALGTFAYPAPGRTFTTSLNVKF